MKWAYGVTTIRERLGDLLPRTLKSLAQAGFDNPHLFVDDMGSLQWGTLLSISSGSLITPRSPRIRTYGNWILSLAEMVIREPLAERYAIFQDDFVTYKNLRSYLEKCKYQRDGYWNLYTFPENQAKIPNDMHPDRKQSQQIGWFPSNQRGKGAVALMFSQDVVYKLLGSPHTWTRLRDPERGWQAVDGGVVTALAHQGIKEYVHNPSLVQHTGEVSSMGHPAQPLSMSFKGENFDALELLR